MDSSLFLCLYFTDWQSKTSSCIKKLFIAVYRACEKYHGLFSVYLFKINLQMFLRIWRKSIFFMVVTESICPILDSTVLPNNQTNSVIAEMHCHIYSVLNIIKIFFTPLFTACYAKPFPIEHPPSYNWSVCLLNSNVDPLHQCKYSFLPMPNLVTTQCCLSKSRQRL